MNKIQNKANPAQLTLTLTIPVNAKTEPGDHPNRDERLASAHAVLARGLAGVRTDPAAMAAFLAFRARFHDYSLNNSVLIWMQRPTARHCMGFRSWTKHGRRVRKGERGLTVFAPVLAKKTAAEIATGTDPDARKVVGYRTAVTFDYEQTEPLSADALVYVPPSPRLNAGDPAGLVARLEHVALFSLGYRVSYVDTGYADGMCQTALKCITVQVNLSPADRASVLAHELCHAIAHADDTTTTRAQKELQAEGAAYVVLAALGLDTSRASLLYLKGWAGGSDVALTAELAAIDQIARDLLARIEAAAA